MLLLEEATHHMGVDMAWNNTHVHQMELLGNTPIGRSCVANVWDGQNSSLLVGFFPPLTLTLTLTNIWLTIVIAKKIGGKKKSMESNQREVFISTPCKVYVYLTLAFCLLLKGNKRCFQLSISMWVSPKTPCTFVIWNGPCRAYSTPEHGEPTKVVMGSSKA